MLDEISSKKQALILIYTVLLSTLTRKARDLTEPTLYLICQFWALPIQQQKRYDVINIDKWGYNFLIE